MWSTELKKKHFWVKNNTENEKNETPTKNYCMNIKSIRLYDNNDATPSLPECMACDTCTYNCAEPLLAATRSYSIHHTISPLCMGHVYPYCTEPLLTLHFHHNYVTDLPSTRSEQQTLQPIWLKTISKPRNSPSFKHFRIRAECSVLVWLGGGGGSYLLQYICRLTNTQNHHYHTICQSLSNLKYYKDGLKRVSFDQLIYA